MVGTAAAGALVAILLLAGCTGPSSHRAASTDPSVAATPTASGDQGSISGAMTDEEQRPIKGVDVGLLQTNRTTSTDANGRFTLNGLEPGRYSLAAGRVGYEPFARAVEVKAGEVTDVQATLKALRLPKVAVVRSTSFDGFLQCSFNPYYFVNPCGDALGKNADHVRLELDPALPLARLLLELEWTPTTAATSQTLELDLCQAPTDASAAQTGCLAEDVNNRFYAYKSGKSPVTVNLTADELPNGTKVFEAWVGNGLESPYPAFQQAFTLHVTTCYVAECPKGTTGLPPR